MPIASRSKRDRFSACRHPDPGAEEAAPWSVGAESRAVVTTRRHVRDYGSDSGTTGGAAAARTDRFEVMSMSAVDATLRHPLDPDPVPSSKAGAVLALGVIAALTGI